MYRPENKNILSMIILRILKDHSDETHQLTQQNIIDKLLFEYGVTCERRTVSRHINKLIDFGYTIYHSKGYYLLDNVLTESQLRMLIDSVLYSKFFSADNAKEIIEKLKSLGNKYFRSSVSKQIMPSCVIRTECNEMPLTVNVISKAIQNNQKITFRYTYYGIDLAVHDSEKEYIMNPYRLVIANGRYYVIGNIDKYDDLCYYRLDKMREVKELKEKRKPIENVSGCSSNLDIPELISEQIYMLQGKNSYIKLKCHKSVLDELVDWFGKNIKIMSQDKTNGDIVVRVACDETAMVYWVMQYGMRVEVLEPASVRTKVAEMSKQIFLKYNEI